MAPVCDGLIFRPSFLAMMRRARPTICCGAQTPVQLWSTALHNELGKHSKYVCDLCLYVCAHACVHACAHACAHACVHACANKEMCTETAFTRNSPVSAVCVCPGPPQDLNGMKWRKLQEISGTTHRPQKTLTSCWLVCHGVV